MASEDDSDERERPATLPDDGGGGWPRALSGCIEILERLAADPDLLASVDDELRMRLRIAGGIISRPAKGEQRRITRALRRKGQSERKARDLEVLSRSGTRR